MDKTTLHLILSLLSYLLSQLVPVRSQCVPFLHYLRSGLYPRDESSVIENDHFRIAKGVVDTSPAKLNMWVWSVDDTYRVKNFTSYSLETGERYLDCDFTSETPPSKCCAGASKIHESTFPSECNRAIFIRNVRNQAYELVYASSFALRNWTNLVAHIGMYTNDGERTFSRAYLSPNWYPCAEMSRESYRSDIGGIYPKNPGYLTYEDFSNTVIRAKANAKIQKRFVCWNAENQVPPAIQLYLNKGNVRDDEYLSEEVQTPQFTNKTIWMLTNLTHFSERIQLRPYYAWYFILCEHILTFSTDPEALIVSCGSEYDLPQVRSLVIDWLNGQRQSDMPVWKTRRPPEVRVMRIVQERTAVWRRNAEVVIPFYCKSRNPVLFCNVKNFNRRMPMPMPTEQAHSDEYGKCSLRIRANHNTTGLISCRVTDFRVFDHKPIIALPDKSDFSVMLREYPWEKHQPLSDSYSYYDTGDRAYLPEGDVQVFASCTYTLSGRLDNYNGLNFRHLLSGDETPIPYQWVNTLKYPLPTTHPVNTHVINYRLLPYGRQGVAVQHVVNCYYLYETDPSLTGHFDPIPLNDRLFHANTTLWSAVYKRPLIVSSSSHFGESGHEAVSPQQQTGDLCLSNLSKLVAPNRLVEGMKKGDFSVFHAILITDVYVWTIFKDGNQLKAGKCSWTMSLVNKVNYPTFRRYPEYEDSHTLIPSTVSFQCFIHARTVGLVYTAHHMHTKLSAPSDVVQHFQEAVLAVAHARLVNKPKKADDFCITDAQGSTSAFRFTALKVGWIGTVMPRTEVQLIKTTDQASCVYATNASTNESSLPLGASVHRQPELMSIVYDSVSHNHSGLYRCKCSDCPEERRLTVLPEADQITVTVETEVIAKPRGKRRMVVSSQPIYVTCSAWIYAGFQASYRWDFKYLCHRRDNVEVELGTGVLGNPHYEEDGTTHWTRQQFFVLGPTPKDNAKFCRILCHLLMENISRDPYDISGLGETFTIVNYEDLDVEDRLRPQIISHMSSSTEPSLQTAMRQAESADASLVLHLTEKEAREKQIRLPPVRFVENVHTISYSAFLGIPKGIIRTWLVHRLEQELHLEPCGNVTTNKLEDRSYKELDIYDESRGMNAYTIHCRTVILPEHIGIVTVIVNAYDFGRTVEEEMESFQVVATNWFRRHLNMTTSLVEQEMADKEWKLFHTKPEYRIIKLNVSWRRFVRTADTILLFGKFNQIAEPKIVCTVKPYAAAEKPVDWKHFRREDNLYVGALILSKMNAEPNESGRYKCVDTNCVDCLRQTGFPAREVFVLPSDDMFGISLSSDRLVLNDPITHSSKLPDTMPAYPGQPLNVRCTHEVFADPLMNVTTRFQIKLQGNSVSRTWPPEVAYNFTVQRVGMTNVNYTVYGFHIITPLFESELQVTCEFRLETLAAETRDANVSRYDKMAVMIRGSIKPTFQENYFRSSTPEMLDRFNHGTPSVTTALRFHQTGPTSKLLETNAHIHLLIHTGFPPASLSVWSYFVSREVVQSEDCYLTHQSSFDDTHKTALPEDVRRTNTYTLSSGKGYVNVTEVCTMQPEYVAIAFVLIQWVTEAGENATNVTEQLRSTLRDHIEFFLANRDSTVEQTFPILPAGVNHVIRLHKVQFGWNASVLPGEHWRMLVSYKALNATLAGINTTKEIIFNVQHRDLVSSEFRLVYTNRTSVMEYYEPVKPAAYEDSGTYYCDVTSCPLGCPVRMVVRPRRLTVLPVPNVLQLYVSDNLTQRLDSKLKQITASIVSDTNSIILTDDDKYYLYCALRLRPLWEAQYYLQLQVLDKRKAILTDALHKPVGDAVRYGEYVGQVYAIAAPDPLVHAGPWTAACVVQFNTSTFFDEYDLRQDRRVGPFVKTVFVRVNHTLRPFVFTPLAIADNQELTVTLRESFSYSLINPTAFHSVVAGRKRIGEGIFRISVPVYLNSPTVRTLLRLFSLRQLQNTVFPEQAHACWTRSLTRLLTNQISGQLKESELYNQTQGNGFANWSFVCAIRAEHVALAIMLYDVRDKKTYEDTQLDALIERNLTTAIQYMFDHPNEGNRSSPTFSRSLLQSYSIVRLHMGWNASIQIGSTAKMLGIVPRRLRFIKCLCIKDAHGRVVQDVSHRLIGSKHSNLQQIYSFKLLNTTYLDSGIYQCNATHTINRGGATAEVNVLGPRVLFIIPDESILHLLLNRYLLLKDDVWIDGQLTSNEPIRTVNFSNEATAYAHCMMMQSDYEIEKQPNFTFQYVAIDSEFKPSYKAMTPPYYKNHTLLYPYEIHTPKAVEYTGNMMVRCGLQFEFTDDVPLDMNNLTRSIHLKSEVLIKLRPMLAPNLFTEFCESENHVLQAALRGINRETSTAVEFHQHAFRERQQETVSSLNVHASLGYPKGTLAAWSVFRYTNGDILSDPCVLRNVKTLEDNDLVPPMRNDTSYKKAEWRNFVLATFICVLRTEHLATVVAVYTTYDEPSGVNSPLEQMKLSIGRQVDYWIKHPNNTVEWELKRPLDVMATFRVVRTLLGWSASVPAGSPTEMLGTGETDQVIECFHQINQTSEWTSLSSDFSVTPWQKSQFPIGFQLGKSSVSHEDTGTYLCNVSDQHSGTKRIGLGPRSLLVMPDVSMLRLVVSMVQLPISKQSMLVTAENKSTDTLHKAYRSTEPYVYCVYPQWYAYGVQPEHTFNYTTDDRNINDSVKLVYRLAGNRTVHLQRGLIHSHRWAIRVPESEEFQGRLWVTCHLRIPRIHSSVEDMNRIDRAFYMNVSQEISILENLKVYIFEQSIRASNKEIESAFRRQPNYTVTSAVEFELTGPDRCIREGLVRIRATVFLGYPEGKVLIYTIYEYREQIRFAECTNKSIVQLTNVVHTIDAINATEQGLQENESFAQIDYICPLLPMHLGIIMVGANAFDTRMSADIPMQWFLRSVQRTMRQWLLENNTGTFVRFSTRPGSAVDYRLIKVCIRRHVAIPVNTPLVLFNLLGPRGEGEVRCIHSRRKNDSMMTPVLFDANTTLQLRLNRTTATYELYKHRSELTDSGFYQCQLTQCPECGLHQLNSFAPKQIIILPDRFSTDIHVDTFPLIPADSFGSTIVTWRRRGNLTVCPQQNFTVHCQYNVSAATWIRPTVRLQLIHAIEEKPIDFHLEMIVRDQVTEVFADYAYMISISKRLELGNWTQILIQCQFDFSHSVHPEDINQMIYYIKETSTATVRLTHPRRPSIEKGSIETDSTNISASLQLPSAYDSTKWGILSASNFLWSIREGIFRGSFIVDLGMPVGWAGVWLLYNQSSNMMLDKCQVMQQTTGLGAMNKTEQPDTQDRRRSKIKVNFRCALHCSHRAIFLYAIHTLDAARSLEAIEQTHRVSLLNTVASLLRLSSKPSDRVVQFDMASNGTYVFSWIYVSAQTSLRAGDQMILVGRLGPFGVGKPKCLFKKDTTVAEPISSEFYIQEYRDLNFFELRKDRASTVDSGWYVCRLQNCPDCKVHLGMPARRVIVWPEPKWIKLYLHTMHEPTSDCNERRTRLTGKIFAFSCVHPSTDDPKVTSHVYHMSYESFLRGEAGFPPKRSSISFIQLGHVILRNHSFTIYLPKRLELARRWYVICRVEYKQVGRYPEQTRQAPSLVINTTRILHGDVNLAPRLIPGSIHTNHEVLTRNLNSPQPRVHFKRSIKEAWHAFGRSMEEGLLKVNLSAFVGEPRGWTFIWLIYHSDGQVYRDPCSVHRKEEGKHEHLRAHCVLQLGHVALVFGVVNQPADEWPTDEIDAQLEYHILANTSFWFDLPRREPPKQLLHIPCYVVDYRLTPLRVSWRNTVQVGSQIILSGRIGGANPAYVKCFRTEGCYSNEELPLHDGFTLQLLPKLDQFIVRNPSAQITDTGYYSCIALGNSPSIPSAGLSRRMVLVTSVPHCEMHVKKDGTLVHISQQMLPDRQFYLVANQEALVRCSFVQNYDICGMCNHSFVYSMYDQQAGTYTMNVYPKNGTLVNETSNATHLTRTYRVTGLGVREATGPLRVMCLTTCTDDQATYMPEPFKEYLTSSSILHMPFSACNVTFVMLEGAHGELSLLSTVNISKPVPVGSEILCTGGNGLPPLQYEWKRLRVKKYEEMDSLEPDYASILPANTGGWGGPERPFVDMPERGLIANGPVLRVPDDIRYRGMSYLYVCEASNMINSTVYRIRREIHISVALCTTNRLQLDAILLSSSTILSACKLFPNEDPELQFYGYYYLTLIRQIILGLPVEPSRVRIGIIREEATTVRLRQEASFVQSIPLSTNFTRFELARLLYSRENKPSSDPDACVNNPMQLNEVLMESLRLVSTMHKSKSMLLFTFDATLKTNLTQQVADMVEALRTTKARIVLAWAHGKFAAVDQLAALVRTTLKPARIVYLVPQLKPVAECDTCKRPLGDTSLRIKRLEVFDAICQFGVVSGMPKRTSPPRFIFSVPADYWTNKSSVQVTCSTANDGLPPSDPFELRTHLTMCLSTEERVNRWKSMRKVSLQKLQRSCAYPLGSSSQLIAGTEPTTSVTANIRLSELRPQFMLLCYKRIGELEPELSDTTSFVGHVLRTSHKITTPKLEVIREARMKEAAAQFRCSYEGHVSNLEVVLLLRPGIASDDGTLQMVASTNVHVSSSLTHSVGLLNWLELFPPLEKSQLYCLVRPRAHWGSINRRLTDFPVSSGLVQLSQPIDYTAPHSRCPQAPLLKTVPKLDGSSIGVSKSPVQITCQVDASVKGLPMKLYVNTPQVLFALCNSDIPEVSDTMLKFPCQFTLEEDSDCSLLMNQLEMTKTNYTVDCFASRSKRSNNVYREIVLNITHLRSDFFDGYVFCETIVQSQRYKDYETGENAYKRLTSEVAHLRLPLTPMIETLLFDPHEEVWKCIGSAHPEVKYYLGIIQVDSELENQVVDTYWHKVIPVVPAWRRLEQLPETYQFDMDDVIYQWELILVPRPPIWKLPPETRLIVQCSFGNESANLTTIIPENVYSTHYRNAGGKLEFNCFFRDSTLDPIRQISINRLIQPGWLEYDLTLGTVIVAGWMEGNWRKLDESELEIRELQLTNAHLWRLHTDRDDRNLRMTIDTLHITEFDSGDYYCTAVTAKNVYYNLAPIPAAVRGTQRGMLFAQRAPELSTRWSIKVPSAVVSKILQTRCLIWTTNIGHNPSLEFNRVPAEHERLLKRNVIFRSQSRMSIVKLMEDWFQVLRSDSSTEGDRIGCTVRDESGRESTKWLIMPSMECTAPESVYWEPFTYSDYRRSAKLQCRAKGGCVSPTLTWAWIAGPIRPSIAMKGWNTSKVCEGDTLHMSRLPGPGAYAFECVASCECSSYPFSTRITVTFFVGESLVNHTLWKDEWQNATSDELFGGTYKKVEKDTQSDVDQSFADIPNELRWKQLHRSQALDSWECHTGGLNEIYECGSEEADMLGKDSEAMDRSVGPDIIKDGQHYEGGYSIDAVGSTRNAEAQLKNNPQVIRWNVLRRGPDARTTFLQGNLQLRTADELAPSIKKLRHTERISYAFGEIAGKHSTRLEKANEYENRVVREYRIEDYLRQVVTRKHSAPHVPSNVDPLSTFLEDWEEWDPWARVAENEFDSTKEFHVEVQRSVLEAEFAQQRKEVEPVHVDKPHHQRVYKRRTPPSAQNRIRSSVGHYLPTNHPVPPRRSTSIQWSWDPKMETDELKQHYGYSQVILRHQKSLSEFSEHNVEGHQQRQMSRKLHTKNSAMTGDEQVNGRPAFWLDDTTFEPGHQMRSGQKEICSGSCNANQEQHRADASTGLPTVPSVPEDTSFGGWWNDIISGRPDYDTPVNVESYSEEPGFASKALTNRTDGQVFTHRRNRYVEETRSRLFTVGGKTNKEHYVTDSTDGYVHINPGLALESDTVTLLCPVIIDETARSWYEPIKQIWLRSDQVPHLTHLYQAKVVTEYSLTRQQYRQLHGVNHTFTYPPFRWPDSYTMDIGSTRSEEFGFYACITTMSTSGVGAQLVNFTRVSLYPLCIIPSVNRLEQPTLWLKEDDHVVDISESKITKCLPAGTRIIVQCRATLYRMFCEREDNAVRGLRLINTELGAQVQLARENGLFYSIPLLEQMSVDHLSERTAQLSEDAGSSYASWLLHLQNDHHNWHVVCETKPVLVRPPPKPIPSYWDFLSSQFVQLHVQQRLYRRTTSVKLCVMPRLERLMIQPEPIAEIGHTIGTIVAKPRQAVECRTEDQRKRFPLMQVFHVAQSERMHFNHSGLVRAWLRGLPTPSKWPIRTTSTYSRLLVPHHVTEGEWYLVRCTTTADEDEIEVNFFIHTQQEDVRPEVPIAIVTPALLVAIILIGMIVQSVSWYRTMQKARTRRSVSRWKSIDNQESFPHHPLSVELWIPQREPTRSQVQAFYSYEQDTQRKS